MTTKQANDLAAKRVLQFAEAAGSHPEYRFSRCEEMYFLDLCREFARASKKLKAERKTP